MRNHDPRNLLILPAVVIGMLLARALPRPGVLLALALPASIAFNLVAALLPFAGFVTEAPVAIAGMIALGIGVAFVLQLAQHTGRSSPTRPIDVIVAAVVLPLVLLLIVSVIFPWMERSRYASDLGWECDGTIVEVYHSPIHHQAPSVAVQASGGGVTKLEGVSPALFDQAHVGDHLHKDEGAATGQLNNRTVQVVRPRWHGK